MTDARQPAEQRTITVWVCDECDYWRADKSTGVHQTFLDASRAEAIRTGRRNIVHSLREAHFIEVSP